MCQTGRCGTSLHCKVWGETPTTIAEFTLGSPDFYDMSVVDGFNQPINIEPIIHDKDNCGTAACNGDLRSNCPNNLAVRANGRIVACSSACQVFNTDQYCCRGNYVKAATCKPTFYSKRPARLLTVMLMMILAAFLHVRDQITSSHIVLQSNTYIFLLQ